MTTGILFREKKLTNKLHYNLFGVLFFLLITALALLVRLVLFDNVTNDYTQFLVKWYDMLKENGGIKAIGLSIGDYTPFYIYILALLTYIPVKSLYAIKIVSCIFDFMLGAIALYVVWEKQKSILYGIAAYAAVLFAPTVWLNSAYWAQCDVIFTMFCVLSVICIYSEKPLLGCAFFGIAFAFKLQAVFIAPFLLLMLLLKKVKIRHLMMIPAVYILSILPAFFAGRSFTELLGVYFSQTGTYKQVTLNAPTVYSFFGNFAHNEAVCFWGVLLCGGAVLAAIAVLWYQKPKVTQSYVVTAALFFALLVPFLLPRMHERYFYLADVLALFYMFERPKRFYVPIVVIAASFFAYSMYLFSAAWLDLRIVTLLLLVPIGTVGYDLFCEGQKSSTRKRI